MKKREKSDKRIKRVATNYPLPNLGFLDPPTAPPIQRFWYALCKERRRRRGRIAIPHGVGGSQTLDGTSLWELLVKETMEKQSDGLGVLVMLISCSDLVIMEGTYMGKKWC